LFEKLKPATTWAKTHIVEPVRRFYPPRQIYFRANGKVRFVSLTPVVQISATFLVLGVFLWTGVATFNYMFMDNILAEKDQELAERQRAFDDLQSDMAQLEVDLQGTVKSVQAKQRYLESLLDEEAETLDAPAGDDSKADDDHEAMLEDDAAAPFAMGGPEVPVEAAGPRSTPAPMEPVSDPPPWRGFKTWLQDLVSGQASHLDIRRSARLQAIAGQVAKVQANQSRLTQRMLQLTDHRINRLSEAITTAGLQVDKVLAAMDPLPQNENMGGPFEALGDEDRLLLESDDDALFKALLTSRDRLEDFDRIMQSFPVVKPLQDYYYVSSSFGVRRDPFTNTRAMHSGLDMASHWKTPIYATAPGTIVKAGWNGAYGRMIEIDHGNGFKTRYGHLKTILVEKGQHVTKGERIALMGSSGRSTGTHLHYEVRFLDKPYNPVKFFKAEQHVLKPDHS